MHFHTFFLSPFTITLYFCLVYGGGEQGRKGTSGITENCSHCLDEEMGPESGQDLPKETQQGGVQCKKPRFLNFQFFHPIAMSLTCPYRFTFWL